MIDKTDNAHVFSITQGVIWGEMDAFQHVNNTVYLRYFEDVRTAYFDSIGVHTYKAQHNIGPILARIECDFRFPLTYPDTLTISTDCEQGSAKKLHMNYQVFSQTHNRIAAEGNGLVVFYDYQQQKSCAIPDIIVKAIALS